MPRSSFTDSTGGEEEFIFTYDDRHSWRGSSLGCKGGDGYVYFNTSQVTDYGDIWYLWKVRLTSKVVFGHHLLLLIDRTSLLEEHILNKKQKQKAISRNLELDELAPEWETELEYLKTQQFTISSVTDAFDKFENLMSETMPIGREADL